VAALNQSFLHGFRHLQLATTELVIWMGLAQQSSGGEELMQRGQSARGNGSGFGLVGRGHGERVFIIALRTQEISNLKLKFKILFWDK
jgi:trehalose utilization protein